MNVAAAFSNKLLAAAYEKRASDIHFYPTSSYTNIYFRIHGQRIFFQQIKSQLYDILLTYYKFTSGMDIGEIRKPQNGTITQQLSHKTYDLRLSTLPVKEKESLAIRILPQEKNFSIDTLFLFPQQKNILKQWTKQKAGIILFTGPTGSGKTTTLYALLHMMLQETSYQMITLEDPIEQTIDNILQVQVNKKAGLTYQTGLKAALRHDPDILMVGEIRDSATAKFAFDASLTGHLVLSTIHAKDASGTVYRLLEMGIKTADIEQSLIGVAALQLLPIHINKTFKRRAAIMELLHGARLTKAAKGRGVNMDEYRHSFHHLRKKAFAYGFISEQTLQFKT